MTTAKLLASNLTTLIASGVNTQDFLSLPLVEAKALVASLVPTEIVGDLFDDGIEVDEADLGEMPIRASFESNEEFYEALVEWLTHADQEPVLINTTVSVGNQELHFNAHRINTKFTLVNESKDGRKFYRLDEIKYCCIVLNNGVEKVNAAQTIVATTAMSYNRTGTLSGFDVAL